MLNRRHMLQTVLGTGAAWGASSLLPAWAKSSSNGNLGVPSLSGTRFDLEIGQFPVRLNGKVGMATGINGTLPGPLLRLREGDDVTMNVTNRLAEDTSIHWHGLLVPFHMDGVPGVSFPGIKPGETFKYQFKVPQNGTYWYHSHSGLQEQLGHYGPIVIEPAGAEPAQSRCGEAAKALDALGLRRMVVGHTPQITAGINACCGGRVYRIDTGLSSFYGGMKQCLEVVSNARPRVISSTPEYFW